MNKKVLIATLIIVIGAGFFAWRYFSQSKTATVQPTNNAITAADITISNFSFSPSTFTVKVGQVVNVVNNDSTQHSLTSDDGLFDTGLLPPSQGGSFSAPVTPGTYKYHCKIHASMTGTLIVQ